MGKHWKQLRPERVDFTGFFVSMSKYEKVRFVPVLGIEQKTAKTFDIKGFALFFVFVRVKKALSKVPEAFAIS